MGETMERSAAVKVRDKKDHEKGIFDVHLVEYDTYR